MYCADIETEGLTGEVSGSRYMAEPVRNLEGQFVQCPHDVVHAIHDAGNHGIDEADNCIDGSSELFHNPVKGSDHGFLDICE